MLRLKNEKYNYSLHFIALLNYFFVMNPQKRDRLHGDNGF